MHKYEVILYWSKRDSVVIGEVPQLEGCKTDGDTYEEALRNIQDAMGLWLKTAAEFGDPIPEPNGRRLLLA